MIARLHDARASRVDAEVVATTMSRNTRDFSTHLGQNRASERKTSLTPALGTFMITERSIIGHHVRLRHSGHFIFLFKRK